MSVDTMPEGPEGGQPEADRGTARVAGHLDRAIQTAGEGGMPISELLGLFFYYAHAIAASYRENVMKKDVG